ARAASYTSCCCAPSRSRSCNGSRSGGRSRDERGVGSKKSSSLFLLPTAYCFFPATTGALNASMDVTIGFPTREARRDDTTISRSKDFMKHSSSHFNFIALLSVTLILLAGAPLAHAQSDIPRETVAITYPLDQAVTVRFRGTTRLPRLSGEAKVKRTGRRNTHVELSVHNLPRANELGGVYTTYVLWAISPEGHADNLGEIKRSGSQFIDSKLDVTTPLQTFALIVTAEPHFMVRGPSRLVVLENLPPSRPGNADVATVSVRYIGNTSDYFNNP